MFANIATREYELAKNLKLMSCRYLIAVGLKPSCSIQKIRGWEQNHVEINSITDTMRSLQFTISIYVIKYVDEVNLLFL